MPPYFDLAWLRAQLDTLGADGLVAALEPPPDSTPDPARLALYQAALLASYWLQNDPSALEHQLYGRLHSHAHLPDIAALRAQMTLRLRPLQEPWLSQAGGALISLSREQRERPSEKRETLPISGPKPDSKWIRLQDGRILTWDWTEPPYVWSSEGVLLGEWPINGKIALDVQQSRDGRYVVTTIGEDRIIFWSPQGEQIRIITDSIDMFSSAEELMDGRWLIYGSNTQPQIWSADLENLVTLKGHKGIFISVRELTDGRLVSMAEALRVWSSDGTLLTTISLPDKDGRWLTLEPGNLLRAWVPFYRITEFWDPSRPDLSPQKHHDGLISGIVPLPDGGALTWSYGWTHDPIRWGSDGTPAATLTGHTKFISGAAVLSDGRILSHSWDTTLRLWSSDGAPLAVLNGHTSRLEAAVLSDGRILSWSWDKTLRLWSSDGEPLAVMTGHTDSVRDACQLMDGRILSGASDRTLRLWSADGAPLMTINESYDRSNVLELRSGRWLSWSKDAYLWSSTGELLAAMDGHRTWLYGACELSDGRLLTWSFYTQVRLWLWSPDGEQLAAIDLPWDIHPAVIRAWFTQHDADWLTFVRHVYQTDGQVMVWFNQNRLDVCDAASGESLTTIYTDSPITAAAMNGQTVIIGCKNGQVMFFRWMGRS
ncbi:MAG: hypothetical protein MUF38_18585 [Anaerolineae bacterium]|jgi:WD40 repeat protein|nr:hypothetical protein [Anaerolineae bacterium]